MTNNTLSVNSDGYAKEVEVKVPLGQPTVNKVGGQRRMLASKSLLLSGINLCGYRQLN